MKITYKIEQYDVDDFIIVITSPEYLAGLHTRIHTPHFLLSELQQHIKTNLNQKIRKFCIKNKQYSDSLRNETLEFEPDGQYKYDEHENSCWFYTGKFIDDTDQDISDKDRNEIYYKNHHRYVSQINPICHLKINREPKNKSIVFQQSFEGEFIDANKLIINFGMKRSDIDYWNRIQRTWCPTGGNSKYGVYFPRYEKHGGRNVYTIREINIFFQLLYDHNKPLYDFFIKNFKKKRHIAF